MLPLAPSHTPDPYTHKGAWGGIEGGMGTTNAGTTVERGPGRSEERTRWGITRSSAGEDASGLPRPSCSSSYLATLGRLLLINTLSGKNTDIELLRKNACVTLLETSSETGFWPVA